MKLQLSKLKGRADIERFVIESVDLSLYIAFVQINGEEHLLADNKGKVLKTTNLLSMQRQIKPFGAVDCVLRQRSAYDEMVGKPPTSHGDNTMELSLGNQPLPDWLN